MNVQKRGKKHSWMGWLTFSGVVLVATICVMVFVPTDQVALEIGALIAGLAAGFLSLRYGVQRRWMFSVILLIFVVVWFILGAAGYAWFGGFLAGIFAAVASVLVKKAPVVSGAEGGWKLNGRGLKTATETRLLAVEALHAFDKRQGGYLSIERGTARFEVAGAVNPGFICHRSTDAVDGKSWAVLMHTAQTPDKSVEVPMGGPKGFMPLRLVQDVASVEAALAGFLKDPKSSSLGPEWERGNEAEATRLTAR